MNRRQLFGVAVGVFVSLSSLDSVAGGVPKKDLAKIRTGQLVGVVPGIRFRFKGLVLVGRVMNRLPLSGGLIRFCVW